MKELIASLIVLLIVMLVEAYGAPAARNYTPVPSGIVKVCTKQCCRTDCSSNASACYTTCKCCY